MASRYAFPSGLPGWLEVLSVVVGLLIACAILWALVSVPLALRVRRRVAAVEAAAGEDPVFGREPVRRAAASLYRELYAALDAGDRAHLAAICGDGPLAGWTRRLDAYERDGRRYHAEVLGSPRFDYVGVMDRPGTEDDWVCLRVRGHLRQFLEDPGGKRRSLPETPGERKIAVDEFWTLRRRSSAWIVADVRPFAAGQAGGFLTEAFSGP